MKGDSFQEIRYNEKRQKILESAGKLFTKKGFEKATLEEIAAKLNLKKGTLYYYVKSKDDLIFAIQMQDLAQANSLIEQVAAKQINPAEKLREIIVGTVKISISKHITGTASQQEFLLPPKMHEQIIVAKRYYQDAFFKIIQQGIEEGFFEEREWKIHAYSTLGAMNWVIRWYDPEGDRTPEQIGEAMTIFFLKAFAKSP